jgi:hypothetical protein
MSRVSLLLVGCCLLFSMVSLASSLGIFDDLSDVALELYWLDHCGPCLLFPLIPCDIATCIALKMWNPGCNSKCQMGYVCRLDVLNKKTHHQFQAKKIACKGPCPSGSTCTLDSNYCENNPSHFPCKTDAFTKNGELKNVYTCQATRTKRTLPPSTDEPTFPDTDEPTLPDTDEPTTLPTDEPTGFTEPTPSQYPDCRRFW